MGTFIYRCSAMGLNVQGITVDRETPGPTDQVYEAVTCTACRRVHLVNPATGHVVGADAEPGRCTETNSPPSSRRRSSARKHRHALGLPFVPGTD
jgi:hypothetical protein